MDWLWWLIPLTWGGVGFIAGAVVLGLLAAAHQGRACDDCELYKKHQEEQAQWK